MGKVGKHYEIFQSRCGSSGIGGGGGSSHNKSSSKASLVLAQRSQKGLAHVKWPKFHNVHALLANGYIDITETVMVLEKLDGSNLGLEIHPTLGLVAIHGRKQVLWHASLAPEEPLHGRCFGPITDTLECLSQEIIPKLKTMAGTLLSKKKSRADAVVFFGEWYKDLQRNEQATWVPFGFFVSDGKTKKNCKEDDNVLFYTMDTKHYQLFVEHGLQPPPILFENGTLAEAIHALYPRMLEPEPWFEGVFITLDGSLGSGGYRGGCKWKTGAFEEQSKFVIREKHITSDEMRDLVAKLQAVYDTRDKKLSPYKPKWRMVDDGSESGDDTCLDLDRQIRMGLHSVLSRSMPIESMSLQDLDKIQEEIIADTQETLAGSGSAIPSGLEVRTIQLVQEYYSEKKAQASKCSEKEEKVIT